MDWNEVASRISEDDRGKWGRKIPATDMWIGEQGKLIAMNGGAAPDAFTLSELAASQFCERLSIPAAYYRRLPAEMKATVANFDLRRLSDRDFLLRGKASHVRAFLSGEYVAYDNQQIAEVTEHLLRSGDLTIKAFVLEETYCFLKVVSEDLVDPIFGLKAGIMIGNSEVVVARQSIDILLLLEQRANEGDVLFDLVDADAGAQQRADPIDQLGRRWLLSQLVLLAQPVKLDQHLVEELGIQVGVVHVDDLPHQRRIGELDVRRSLADDVVRPELAFGHLPRQ
jgi:hypothetical protein